MIETRKKYMIAFAVAGTLVASFVVYYAMLPKYKEKVSDALEVISVVDPHPDKYLDVVNITVKWNGHDNIYLSVMVIEQPPHGGYDQDRIVNYGDVFSLYLNDYGATFEIFEGEDWRNAPEIVHMGSDGKPY